MAGLVRRIALIRAINVGGHVVKMAELRQLFVDMDFQNVSTVIASGNVIFETTAARAANRAKLQDAITASLTDALGFEADTFVRTPEELHAIGVRTPLDAAHAADDTSVLYVNFLRDAQQPDAGARLAELQNPVDEFALHGLELYWLQHRAKGESQVKAVQMARIISGPTTSRNIKSVRRIAAAANSGD